MLRWYIPCPPRLQWSLPAASVGLHLWLHCLLDTVRSLGLEEESQEQESQEQSRARRSRARRSRAEPGRAEPGAEPGGQEQKSQEEAGARAGLFLTLDNICSLVSLSQRALDEDQARGGSFASLDAGNMDAQEKGAGEEVVQIWDKRQDLDLKPREDDPSLPRPGEKGSAEDPAGDGLEGDEATGPREPGSRGEEGDEDSSVPFSEILHLVQTGQEIPGLQKLNINATQESPTASQMPRRSKPWETTV